MNAAVRNMLRAAIVFALPAVPLWAGAAVAEDYVLGADDVIAVSVWLHPELERTVTINGSGMITYPPLGEMQAAGLTPRQLGDRLAERLGGFLRQTTAVTVTVTQFMSRSVFVSGAVARRGRYGFERIPGLIDAISQAGGALPGADLSRVQVVRKEGETHKSIDADVASALRDGIGVQLPELRPGDTIFRLRTAAELDGSAAVDIGTARPGIELFDDGTRGDTQAADGIDKTDYTVETTYDANSSPVLIRIRRPPPAVTLQSAIPQGLGRVLLLWSQSGASDFQSDRLWHVATTPVLSSGSRILDTTLTVRTATTVVADSIAVGSLRWFVVEVVDNAGNATPSNELSITPTLAGEVPAGPSGRLPAPAVRPRTPVERGQWAGSSRTP